MSYFDTLKELRRKFYGEQGVSGVDKVVETAQTQKGIFERPTEVNRGTPRQRTPEPEPSESFAEFSARMRSYGLQARQRMMNADVTVETDQRRQYRPKRADKPEEMGVPQQPVSALRLERNAETTTPQKTQEQQLKELEITSKFTNAFTPAEVLADAAFMGEVRRVSNKWGFSPNDLMAVINFETGGTFDPSIRNPQKGSTATGLIQFIGSTARGLGTTVDELAQMSRAEQMLYVDKYLEQFGDRAKGASLEDLYMLILNPVSAGKPADTPLFTRGTQRYEMNKSLDVNEDGVITKAEATERVRRRAGLMTRRT